MQDASGEPTLPSFRQEILFNGGFSAAVVVDRITRMRFRNGSVETWAMNPNRPAVNELPHTPLKRGHELPGAFQLITREVHNHVRCKIPGFRSDRTGRFLSFAVDINAFHVLPGFMRNVGLTLRPADAEDLMPRFYQTGCEVRADVARASDNDNASRVQNSSRSLAVSIFLASIPETFPRSCKLLKAPFSER